MASPDLEQPRAATPLSVSELAERLQASFEQNFRDIWVAGEISGLRTPASGHLYFALKDQQHQLRAVMFRGYANLLRFEPEDGLEVAIKGRVGLYAVRGDLQLYASYMEPLGLGGQQLALEQLKAALAAEGLFAPERKRPLPFFPRSIGVVTARSGAAIHDILTILHQRCPYTRVVLRPSLVQGADAGVDIATGIQDLNDHGEAEVLIVGRGGGSSEDLSAFNQEIVARAIAASQIPVVAAVGHEIDLSIADLVADRRAATPTAAAEMVVPRLEDLSAQIAAAHAGLTRALQLELQKRRNIVEQWRARIQDPSDRITLLRSQVQSVAARLTAGVRQHTQKAHSQVQEMTTALNSLSPLAVLNRGYSLTRTIPAGKVVSSASQVQTGDLLRVTFSEGEAQVRVETVSK